MTDINQQFAEKVKCLNCQAAIDESQQFCMNCGQKTSTKRLAFWQIMSEAIKKVFEMDEGGFLHTFKELSLRPEKVPTDYIMGKRVSFMKPVPYFIIPMVLYIFLSNGLDVSTWAEIYEDLTKPKVENITPKNQDDLKYLLALVKDQRLFIFTTVIGLSLSYKLFFRKKKFNFAEHMVFNLYTQGHVLLLSIPILILAHWVSEDFIGFIYLISFIYSIWVIKRFYQTNIFKASFAYMIGYIIYYTIVTMGIMLSLSFAGVNVD